MSRSLSPSVQHCCGTARVCRVWGLSRATIYRHRRAASAANDNAGSRRRRGPIGAGSDAELLAAIRAEIKA